MGARGDGRGNLQRANEVIQSWTSSCLSFSQVPNSQHVTAPCMISGCASVSSNWTTGLCFLLSTIPGTAEESARGSRASSTGHPSTPWCKTSSMRSLTPLFPGPRVSPPTTAPSVSWSLKRTALTSTRSLKTWSPPGVHVAKPATNMPFCFSGWSECQQTLISSHHTGGLFPSIKYSDQARWFHEFIKSLCMKEVWSGAVVFT